MSELRIKATITPDHKLSADVPAHLPTGEVVVVIRTETEKRENAKAVQSAMIRAYSAVKVGRTKEDIDRELTTERATWE